MVKIEYVDEHSRAQKAGLVAGDYLVSINGKEINDVLDYRFYLADKDVFIVAKRGEEKLEFEIKKREYDDIGLEFETPLMDKKHSCENKCVFCFIDQLPKGLRSSLYFKDDDSRLSFLHGNYITMTNLNDRDIQRIIEMHISPVNISVHTTNPELRIKMMHNKRAGDVLKYLKWLADAGIKLCCQIVLCKGLNDKEELDRTLHDLVKLYPSMESTAIVPAGLTRYREKLYPLQSFNKEECREIINQINAFGDICLEKYGTRLFYPADEFYVKGEVDIPSSAFYEEFSQIENGVGMLTELSAEFKDELEYLDEYTEKFKGNRKVSVATGYAAYKYIDGLCTLIKSKVEGLEINVYPIKNNFFGGEITVSGLLTYTDMSEQLKDADLGDCLLIPSETLRAERDLFLDGKTPDELSKTLNIPVRPVENQGTDMINAILGI